MLRSFLIIQIGGGIILSFLYVADFLIRFGCVLEITNDSIFG